RKLTRWPRMAVTEDMLIRDIRYPKTRARTARACRSGWLHQPNIWHDPDVKVGSVAMLLDPTYLLIASTSPIPLASIRMKVKRIVANLQTSNVQEAETFYGDLLGLDLLMDHGWFRTYGSDARMTVQVSFGSEGGSGTPVPDLSIEVDDVEAALERFKQAGVPIEYGPANESWGVRRFYVRDPFGRLVNILQHACTRHTLVGAC